MNQILNSADLAEATRLTRAGRLAEATALLQRSLGGQGGGGSVTPPQASPFPGGARPFLDMDPATGEFRQGDAAAASAAAMPEALRGLLGKRRPGAAGFARRPAETPAPTAPLPEGARFLSRSHASEAGSRPYKLYIPASRRSAASPSPLLVMLHGCTQSPDDFAAGTRMNELAEEHGFLVAYPAQPASANAQRCWNWFSPSDQRRGAGEPAILAGLTREVVRSEGADPGRVFVAGLSAGGAAAAILGLAYPEIYAAVGVHSGLACGAARDLPSAFAAMKGGGAAPDAPARGRPAVRTIVFHADRDATVHPLNGDQVAAQAAAGSAALRREVERGQAPGGGHGWTRTRHLDAGGRAVLEQWVVHGGGHAWSGGSPAGSYTDPRGPDASREMLRFFLDQ